jgi:hypothetical protein
MYFSSFISSWFLFRCRRFSLKKQNFQSVRTFHNDISIHLISWLKYLLKMQINSRVYLVKSFIRSIFFNSRRLLRARFDENEWTFKAYNVIHHQMNHFYQTDSLFSNDVDDSEINHITYSICEVSRSLNLWLSNLERD